MKIILRKMNAKFEWQDYGSEITVKDNAEAMKIVFQKEDQSGGRDSFNYRVVEN